jgi:malate synthase
MFGMPVRGTIEYLNPEGKRYALNDQVATLLVRPRGWHLSEKHIRVDGQPISASLFDFALYVFHNARHRMTPRFRYLPVSAQAGAPPGGPPLE